MTARHLGQGGGAQAEFKTIPDELTISTETVVVRRAHLMDKMQPRNPRTVEPGCPPPTPIEGKP